MEEQKKSRKPLLVGVIAAVLVLVALLALLLTQCVGGTGPSDTSGTETTAPVVQKYDLYWNVDRNNFEAVEGESTTGRKPADDGFYHMVFAIDGKQVELRVKERRLVNIIDAFDIVSLVFDENGDVIDVVRLDDMPYQKITWQYYIQSFGGNAIKLNSSKDMNGMEEMIKTNDQTVIYDVSGWSEFVGAPGKLQKNDRAYVLADEEGNITHIFLYERDGIERTVRAECKHCGEEVTWKNWMKKDSLPITTGHYFLENDVDTKKQNQIQDDAKICLDLNGCQVYSKSVARIYSTFYAGSSLAVMDNSEEKKGIIISEGQNMDQGSCLWARYGNIDIYDITVDGSGATSHAGGTAVCVESTSTIHFHSGKLIGGKLVTVKGKSNVQVGATVWVNGNGKFIMEPGTTIIGGETPKLGGAVAVSGNGTFTMNGGKISGGRTKGSNGGAVAVTSAKATFNMHGGTISGGRAYRSDKNANGAGGNVVCYGTFNMYGGTISGGRAYNYDGTLNEKDPRQNFFIVNGKLYMYGGKIAGSMQAVDTNLKDNVPCLVYVSGGAKISGAPEGMTNLTLNNGVKFQAGKLSGKAEIYVSASGIFSEKTRESNVNYVHSDDPNVNVVYYNECLALGRMQCICGASQTEGKAHAGPCDGTLVFFGPFSTQGAKSTSGNYYLTKDFENLGQLSFGTAAKKDENGQTVYADPITINLDLNGHTINSSNRSILAMSMTTLNITDSVGGGKITGRGVALPYTNAGVLLIQKFAEINILGDVTLVGREDMHETMLSGGVAEVSGVLNMYHGTLVGGTVGGSLNAKGAQRAGKAGAVNVNGGGILNMYNDAKITGGATKGPSAHGGNVYVANTAQLNMFDNAVIENGAASPDNKGGGGNVYIAAGGSMSMQDNAKVVNGKADPKTQPHSQDVFCVNGKFYLNGGHVGVMAATNWNANNCKLVVANNASIELLRCSYGNDSGKTGATKAPQIEINGVLTDDAMIVLNGAKAGAFTTETVAENQNNFATSTGDAISYSQKDKKLYVGDVIETLYHCVCGMKHATSLEDTNYTVKGECFGECDGSIKEWTPWTGTQMPNKTGYWVMSAGTYSQGVFNGNVNIYIDLAGKAVKTNFRAFQFKGSDGTDVFDQTLTITDSVGSGSISVNAGVDEHSSLMMNNKRTTPPKITFNLYGGHLDASKAKCTGSWEQNGAVNLGVGAAIKMFGGKVTGQGVAGYGSTTTDKRGSGGAFHLASGTQMVMTGGEIVGSKVNIEGGAICVATGATLLIDGGKVTGGEAALGGAISSMGTVIIKDAVIDGGVAVRDVAKHSGGMGGAIYVAGGEMIIDNSVINGGYVDTLDTTDSNAYGGSAICVKGGSVQVLNGSKLNGYTAKDTNIRRGGTVAVFGGSMTLNNSTISGSKVLVNAAAVYVNNGSFTMTGENAAITMEDVGTKVYGGAVTVENKGSFKMEDGIINGTEITYTNMGGGAVTVFGANAKLELAGGKITGGKATKNNGGGVYIGTGSTLTISGDIQITGNEGGNLFLDNGAIVNVGTMSEEANVGVTLKNTTGIFSNNKVAATTGFVSDNTAYAVERQDGKLAIMTAGTGNGDGEGGSDPDEPTPPEPVVFKPFHCICGNHFADDLAGTNEGRKADCFGDCDGTIHEWVEWTGNNLPNRAGYWFIGDETKTYTQGIISGDNVAVFIDLAGKTVDYKLRAFRFDTTAKSETVLNQSLTITDSVSGGSLNIIEDVDQHSSLMMAYKNSTSVTPKVTFALYGGHLNASGASCTGSWENKGAINIGKDATINLYGGMITGQTVNGFGAAGSENTKLGQGGAIYLTNGSKLTMSGDAQVIGGTVARQGGAIYIEGGASMTMEGNAVVSGGVANNAHGGCIYVATNAELTMKGNAKVEKGDAAARGGCIYVNGKFTIEGNASVLNGTIAGAAGVDGDVCSLRGEMIVKGGHIGSLVSQSYNGAAATLTVSGAPVIDALNLRDTYAEPSFTGTKAPKAVVDIEGTLEDEAKIHLVMTEGTISSATVEANTDNFTVDGYLVKFNTTDNTLYIDDSAGVNHCLCGASVTGGTHKAGCDGTVLSWQPLVLSGTGSVNLTQSGNYYLTGNITNRTNQITIKVAEGSGIDVKIDLNGFNMKSSYRVWQVWFDSSLTITNTTCNPANGVRPIEGGIIEGTGCADGNGVLQVTNYGKTAATNWPTKLNVLQGVTLKCTAGTEANKSGSVVGLGGGAVANFYGVKMISETGYIQDGVINMASGTTVNLVDCEINGDDGLRNGAAIFTGGNLTISGNTVINGAEATGNGGAIYVGGGKTVISGNAVVNAGTATNGNAIFLNAGELELQGGTIEGDVYVNGGKITVSGDVKVNPNATTGKGIVLAYVEGTKDMFLNVGTMGEEASVVVGKAIDTKLIARPENITDAEWQAYRAVTAKLVAENGLAFSFEADGIYFRDAIDDNENAILYHCVCGAKGGETHLGECTGYDIPWQAWTGNTMPNQNGNWYMVDDTKIYTTGVIGAWDGVAGTTESPSFDVKVDLNGKTINMRSNTRMFSVGTANVSTITLTDSVGGGKVLAAANATADQAMIAFNRSGLQNNLIIYGGTYDMSAATNASQYGGQGAVDLGNNAVIKMFGGTVIGMNVNKAGTGYGGAFYLRNGSVMTVSGDAKIYGGEVANCGGAIYMADNVSLTLSGNAQIIGGTSASSGGTVYMSKEASDPDKLGSLTLLDNASIIGGTTTGNNAHGGAVYAGPGTVITMEGNSSITGGNATNAQGGNVYANGTLIVKDNATITGGACQATNPQSADVFVVGGHLQLSGNAHVGATNITAWSSVASIKVANAVKIDQLNIACGTGQTLPYVQIEGTLEDGAVIYMRTTGVVTTATVQENLDNIKSRYGYAVTFEADNTIKVAAETGAKHCLCGASVTGGEHVKGCDGAVLTWTPYPYTSLAGNDAAIPAGNYYLTKDLERTSQLLVGGTAENPKVVNIDLNGWNIVATGHRNFGLRAYGTLGLTNTRTNPGLGFNEQAVVSGEASEGNWASVQMHDPNKTETMVLNVWPNVSIENNMTITHNNGSTVAIYGGGTMNMYGGQVLGGTAQYGGAVKIDTGVLNMYNDSLITGGLATLHGGNVYVGANGELTMADNAKIVDGVALNTAEGASYGGNVILYGQLEMSGNAQITGGSCKTSDAPATEASFNAAPADIFAVGGVTMNLSGGHIGRISWGGSGNATYNFSGKITIDWFNNFKSPANITGALDAASRIRVNGNAGLMVANVGTWTPEQLAGFAPCFVGNAGTTATAEADGIYLRAAQ